MQLNTKSKIIAASVISIILTIIIVGTLSFIAFIIDTSPRMGATPEIDVQHNRDADFIRTYGISFFLFIFLSFNIFLALKLRKIHKNK